MYTSCVKDPTTRAYATRDTGSSAATQEGLLNSESGWSAPKNDLNQWSRLSVSNSLMTSPCLLRYQIDLGSLQSISGLYMLGCSDKDMWVSA